MKILIVDDVEENLFILESLLEYSGYEVSSANNGEEALKILRSSSFDLIISDILMPIMDGYQLLREIKSDSSLKEIFFIYYTATYTSPKDAEFGRALGADQFLLKPAEPEDILKAIESLTRSVDGKKKNAGVPSLENEGVLKLYNERLINKLEKKMIDLKNEVEEREKTEIELKASESKYRSLVESLPQKVFLKNTDSIFIACNANFAVELGISEEEVAGKNDYDFYPKEVAQKYIAEDKRVLLSKKTEEFEEETVVNGGTSWSNTVKSPVLDENGNVTGILGIFWDITERKNLEIQLVQSQKMESVGRLAGGIAHDFNNILTAIIGTAELAAISIDEKDPFHDDFKEILKSGLRASDLTRQLLAFSRKQKLEPKVLYLNTLITNLHKMLLRIIEENIDLKLFLSEDLWKVKVDPGQVEQVIVNLVVNARDSMPDGGNLVIETQNITLEKDYTKMHNDIIAGDYAMLSISDSGCGMSKEVLTRVFDPFYTTKTEGEGTGLGLSTVYGIVKQSNGFIWVYSEEGEGSTFKIYLPMVKELSDDIEIREKITEAPRGNETVLIVEDEDAVRQLTSRILRRQGYKVIEADSGGTALVLCQKMDRAVDLAITDVIMPHMNGVEFVELLREKWPDSKVMFMSGYTENALIQNKLLGPDIPYLQKPFRPIEISLKVREVLDS